MITLTFPDGASREYPSGTTGLDVALSIAPSLAKRAMVVVLDGQMHDLKDSIQASAKLEFITRNDVRALEIIRHDCAHVLAEAVQTLFPGTQVTIGPVIDHGFFYDFHREKPFTPEELPLIEAKMREIIARNAPFTKEVWSREQTKAYFKAKGELFKVELVDAIPEDQDIKIYKQGDWLDLCRGPHAPSTSHVGNAFKLLKVAGAYWRGDSKNPMLTRIYGTAFAEQKDLDAYLHQVEEAERRDHRRLAKEMDLFHLQHEAHGSVFWHPNGYMIWRQLEAYMRRSIDDAGYVEVKTPQVMNAKQWEASGHWGKYRENMFVIPDEVPNSTDEGSIISGQAEWMALKPMNCPAHVLIFKQGIKSYRDLPLRIYENGCCHRNEPHGALHGLMRVRQFTQDDAHIFCREDQIIDEVRSFCELADRIYKHMGFTSYAIKLALRPEQRYGSDEMWDRAENELRNAVIAAGMATAEYGWEELPGEGAFYAPKLEWHLTDAIGRTWQVGTIQSDRVLPERLDATYVGEDGERHRPVMLHRAIFGSYERFIGILIEHFAGHFPLWLAPVQLVVTTITSEADAYASEVYEQAVAAGLRVDVDLRNEKINYKVREHSLAKVPVMFVVGKKEAENGQVSIRRLGSQDTQTLSVTEALDILKEQAKAPF